MQNKCTNREFQDCIKTLRYQVEVWLMVGQDCTKGYTHEIQIYPLYNFVQHSGGE